MRLSSTLRVLSLARFFILAAVFAPIIQGAMVFDYGTSWRYRIGTSEAYDPRGEWRQVTFNHSAWGEGATPV